MTTFPLKAIHGKTSNQRDRQRVLGELVPQGTGHFVRCDESHAERVEAEHGWQFRVVVRRSTKHVRAPNSEFVVGKRMPPEVVIEGMRARPKT